MMIAQTMMMRLAPARLPLADDAAPRAPLPTVLTVAPAFAGTIPPLAVVRTIALGEEEVAAAAGAPESVATLEQKEHDREDKFNHDVDPLADHVVECFRN